MNIFFLHMLAKKAAKMHANIHVVKMVVETAQLLCNVHHRQREIAMPPYTNRARVPYKDSAAGHRKLGSMVWLTESLGNYRWAVELGLALCDEYNNGRGRAAGKTTKHKTQKVLEWLRDHEPNYPISKRTPVRRKHFAMPDEFKKTGAVQAYRDYYFSKRLTMTMVWPAGQTPTWWEAKCSPKNIKEEKAAEKKRKQAKLRATLKPSTTHGRKAVTQKRKSAVALKRPSSHMRKASVPHAALASKVKVPTLKRPSIHTSRTASSGEPLAKKLKAVEPSLPSLASGVQEDALPSTAPASQNAVTREASQQLVEPVLPAVDRTA